LTSNNADANFEFTVGAFYSCGTSFLAIHYGVLRVETPAGKTCDFPAKPELSGKKRGRALSARSAKRELFGREMKRSGKF
jgi:hypothetical protein